MNQYVTVTREIMDVQFFFVLYGWDNDRIFAEYDDKGDVIQETVYFGSTPVALLKKEKRTPII